MRILLADDDTGVIQALLAILKSVPGYEVRVGTTGGRALENATALGGVDLLITDVVMEPMDGFTLRDEVLKRFPEARTILISGYDLSDYAEQTRHGQLLTKPIDRETLLAAIEREFAPPPEPQPVARAVAVPVARGAQPQVARSAPVAAARPAARPASAPQPAARPAAAPRPAARPAVHRPAQPAPQAPRAGRPGAQPAAAVRPAGVAPRPAPSAPRAIAVGQPVARVTQPAPVEIAEPDPVETSAAVEHDLAPAPHAPRAGRPGAQPAAAVRPAGVAPRPAQSAPRAIAVGQPVARVAQPAPVEIAEPDPVETSAAVEHDLSPAPEPDPAETPAAPEPADLRGQTLGAYKILSRIGQGRWGTVYAAVQTAINRPVALKVLDSTQAHDAETRTRFIADARAKAHVQHPSTLAVFEAGEAAGHIFYAHEFVDGQTLAQIKASGQKLDEATALHVLRTAAEGLAYLTMHHIPHAAPVPGSIYLGMDGGARLSNLATLLADEQLPIDGEIQALGRILLGVLPPLPSLTPGLQGLVKSMVQQGPHSFVGWGQLLQGIKALEPKIVPVEAARISAQDRAAVAAVAQLRHQQKRALYVNLASFISLVALVAVFGVVGYRKFFTSNERIGDTLVHIPAGEFPFGANAEPVTLPEFWIDKYEVTYGQYAKFVAFLEKNPTAKYDDPRQPPSKSQDMHKPKEWDVYYGRAVAGKPVHSVAMDLNCPVMEIDWWDAAAYAKWKGRELPTEQEWEKAGRGTKGFIYPWGDEPDDKKANSNADYKPDDPGAAGTKDGYNFWNPVDQIKGDKSPFGVIGMAGNVAEWIATWDPVKKWPLIKGGSFMSADLRLDSRKDLEPYSTSEAIGFRTVTHTPPAKK